jgi:protease-4
MAVALAQILLPIPARAEDPPPKEKPKIIIPVFRLSGPLSEAPADETLPFFAPPGASLKTLIARLGKSAVDTNVPAVVILPESASLGMAQAQELRQAVAQFRGHGKEVYVHASSLGTAQYLVASAASRVSVTPTGQLMIPGLHAESMHVRGLLDKIGVKPDFITEGAYKSASELFMREQPSPEADQMMNWLLDSWDGSLKEMVGRSRAADAAKVQSPASSPPIRPGPPD